ncbi:MAG: FtsX-like permease family protein [Bacteroidales bacterium]
MKSRYFKQAWTMLMQNKLFSTLYIIGTGLAIAMSMIIFMFHYIKVAPIYPENNRNQIYILKSVTLKNTKDNWQTNWRSSYYLVQNWWYTIQSTEKVSAEYINWKTTDYIQFTSPNKNYIDNIKVKVKYTDPEFFEVFNFEFKEGTPFSREDFESGVMNAVITESTAKRIFGTIKAQGKRFSVNFNEYRVAGVVKDASILTPNSFAQIYLPYTICRGYDKDNDNNVTGGYTVYFKIKNKEQGAALEKETNELVRKYNASMKDSELTLGGPDIHWKSTYRRGNQPLDFSRIVSDWGMLVFMFLLVPALNLIGMISFRMESRLPEMGIQKAFGATKKHLLLQVLNENLILTCIGGLLGLIIAWSTLVIGRNWVFTMFEKYGEKAPEGVDTIIRADMLFSPVLFLIAFTLCALLNLGAALIPAWRSLRKNIVYSLNQKK